MLTLNYFLADNFLLTSSITLDKDLDGTIQLHRESHLQSRFSHRHRHHIHHIDFLLSLCVDGTPPDDPVVAATVASGSQQRPAESRAESSQFAEKVAGKNGLSLLMDDKS